MNPSSVAPVSLREEHMTQQTADFLTLVAQARAGNNEALAGLIQEYEPKIRLVARAMLGPALRPFLDATDLVQSVHKSLLLGLRGDRFVLSRPEDLLGLTITLVRRKVARHWRRIRRQLQGDCTTNTRGSLAEVLSSLTARQDDPARAAEYNDQLKELCRHLSDEERQMLELRLDGHTFPEIAAVLGHHPIALRVRMTRLRQRLKENGVFTECF
jgi:RNA polymerase sigma-70 factor (ECF subfamily)